MTRLALRLICYTQKKQISFCKIISRHFAFKMFTNRDIFSDLVQKDSKPKLSNPNYKSDVQSWLLNHVEVDHRECKIILDWTNKTSAVFSDYAKDIYPTSGYSVHNILSGTKHRSWLDKSIDFPIIDNCLCSGCQPKDENDEVNTHAYN